MGSKYDQSQAEGVCQNVPVYQAQAIVTKTITYFPSTVQVPWRSTLRQPQPSSFTRQLQPRDAFETQLLEVRHFRLGRMAVVRQLPKDERTLTDFSCLSLLVRVNFGRRNALFRSGGSTQWSRV